MSWAYKILARAKSSFLSEKVTESLVGWKTCAVVHNQCVVNALFWARDMWWGWIDTPIWKLSILRKSNDQFSNGAFKDWGRSSAWGLIWWLSFHFPSALFAAVNFQMSFSTLKYPPSLTAAALECEGVARLAGRSLQLEESSDVTSLTLGRSLGISSCLSLKTAFKVYLQPSCSGWHRKASINVFASLASLAWQPLLPTWLVL